MTGRPLDRPLLLAPGNVTAPNRTPWGGRRIAALKAPFVALEGPVGESWEVSFGPELPSMLDDGSVDLGTLGRARGAELFGREAERGGSSLLVKLIDTDQPLSVQIHPADDAPQLRPGESGKPECWLVTHAEPGAQLWLGLTPEANEAAVRAALAGNGDVGALFARHEVRPGDFFVLEPGTPHAIGAGLSIVEPQLVRAGKRGITYRYYDWDRRYDEHGAPSPAGRARALHVEEAIGVTDWSLPRGAAILERTRLRVGEPDLEGPLRAEWLAGRRGLRFPMEVVRLTGTGSLPLQERDVVCGVTVTAGSVVLAGAWGETRIDAGRSALLPAAMPGGTLLGHRAHAVLASVG